MKKAIIGYKRFFLILMLLLPIGVLLRYLLVSDFLILKDSYKFLLISEAIADKQSLGYAFFDGSSYPDFTILNIYKWLLPVIVGLISRVSSFSLENTYHFFVILFDLLGSIILYQILRKLNVSRKLSILGLFFYLFSGARLVWSAYIIVDTLATILLLTSTLLFLKIYDEMSKGFEKFQFYDKRLIALSACISAAFLTRPELLVLLLLFVTFLILKFGLNKRNLSNIFSLSLLTFIFSLAGYLMIFLIIGRGISLDLNIRSDSVVTAFFIIIVAAWAIVFRERIKKFISLPLANRLILGYSFLLLALSSFIWGNLIYELFTVTLFIVAFIYVLFLKIGNSRLFILNFINAVLITIYFVFNRNIVRYYLIIQPILIITSIIVLQKYYKEFRRIKRYSFLLYFSVIVWTLLFIGQLYFVFCGVKRQDLDYQQVVAKKVEEVISFKNLEQLPLIVEQEEPYLYYTNSILFPPDSFQTSTSFLLEGNIEANYVGMSESVLVIDEGLRDENPSFVRWFENNKSSIDLELVQSFKVDQDYRRDGIRYKSDKEVEVYIIRGVRRQ